MARPHDDLEPTVRDGWYGPRPDPRPRPAPAWAPPRPPDWSRAAQLTNVGGTLRPVSQHPHQPGHAVQYTEPSWSEPTPTGAVLVQTSERVSDTMLMSGQGTVVAMGMGALLFAAGAVFATLLMRFA